MLPSGTVDLNENELFVRNYIFDTAKNILKLRGATQIETPVIELFSTVESLYGGDFDKSVYLLNDDDEKTSKLLLRYDLTVPFARYVGTNGLTKFRRFQYGKVYRRDKPQIQQGRYREFYQFDYDIVGGDNVVVDLEMLETLNELMTSILSTESEEKMFTIKINYKQIVLNMLKKCLIPDELLCATFSAIDKLDKKTFNEIKDELETKGLNNDMILRIEEYYNVFSEKISFEEKVKLLNSMNLINEADCYNDLLMISSMLNKMKLNNFILDPFLIRGMNYYTGILYEVVYNNKDIIGSTIAAGGRYDNMIDKFSSHSGITSIGLSLGVERLSKILEQTKFSKLPMKKIPDIYVASIGKNSLIDRIVLCNELRKMGYYTMSSDSTDPKMRSQFTSVFEDYGDMIPVMVVIGETEIKENKLTIKDIKKKSSVTVDKNDGFKIIHDILKLQSTESFATSE